MRIEKLATAKIKYVSLQEGGRVFAVTILGIGKGNWVNIGDYRSEDPRVIRLFRDFFVRRRTLHPSPSVPGNIFPAEVSFVATNGHAWGFEADPINPETNGLGYMAALDALSDDLARQYARLAGRMQADMAGIRKVNFEAYEDQDRFKTRMVFARRPALTPADIPAALKALGELDRRAFVFGDGGFTFQLAFEHADGKKTGFRLRPPVYKDVKAASRMANPPVPQPLWSWVAGKPGT
jgi:hypothetical protein